MLTFSADECQQKYGSATVWKACCNVFDYLNLAAVRIRICHWRSRVFLFCSKIIDGETLCVHGGLSPDIRTLDQIRVLSRAQEIPHEGAFCGMLFAQRQWFLPDKMPCRPYVVRS
jgi:serine/threonine-protein phosphatase 6 catalytic subunit